MLQIPDWAESIASPLFRWTVSIVSRHLLWPLWPIPKANPWHCQRYRRAERLTQPTQTLWSVHGSTYISCKIPCEIYHCSRTTLCFGFKLQILQIWKNFVISIVIRQANVGALQRPWARRLQIRTMDPISTHQGTVQGWNTALAFAPAWKTHSTAPGGNEGLNILNVQCTKLKGFNLVPSLNRAELLFLLSWMSSTMINVKRNNKRSKQLRVFFLKYSRLLMANAPYPSTDCKQGTERMLHGCMAQFRPTALHGS